jgi:transcription-repair coupling factor (superfamily II helicase)
VSDAIPSPGQIALRVGRISESFLWPSEKLAVLCESDILGSSPSSSNQQHRGSKKASGAKNWSSTQILSDLNLGDKVVHVEHGIGCYQGIARLELSGALNDFLLLEYANRDRLYLPIYRLNTIQKYVGAGESVALDQLGSQHFKKIKEHVKQEVKKLAFSLVDLYAKRNFKKPSPFHRTTLSLEPLKLSFPLKKRQINSKPLRTCSPI